MKKEEVETHKSRLLDMSESIRVIVEDLSDRVQQPTGGEASGGISNVPVHIADMACEVNAQELSSVILEQEMRLEQQISAALGRIRQGTFGVCEHCGKTIPAARLEAVPYSQYCVICSERADIRPRPNSGESRSKNRRQGSKRASPASQRRPKSSSS
jgi:DnaK suppressor protein